MNITVRNVVLTNELRLLSKIAPTKATIPILNYVHLAASNDRLSLESTDLSLALRTTCPSGVQSPGETMLPAKKLLELLEQLPDIDITIDAEDKHAVIIAGTFKSKIQTMPAADFPQLPAVQGDVATVSAGSLRLLIERASYAIAEKTQKYVIDGALLSCNGPVMAMVSTDGKRLSVATAARPEGPALNVLVPSQTLDMLTAFLADGDVEISVGERHLFFTSGPRVLISRMIDGQFPKYDKIIPRDSDKHVAIDRMSLIAALRRVAVIASEEETVVFSIDRGTVGLSSKSAGLGEADETVPANYDGMPLNVSASGKHVLDFLDRATERTINLALKTAESPMLWTDGSDFLNVVLVRRS